MEFGSLGSLETPGAPGAYLGCGYLVDKYYGVWEFGEFRSLRQEPNNSVYLASYCLASGNYVAYGSPSVSPFGFSSA